MTAEDKRDRRKARQEVEAAFRALINSRMGLYATNRQLKAAVKVMADRYYAEQVRPAAERIERELIAKAEEKAAVAVWPPSGAAVIAGVVLTLPLSPIY